MLNEEQLANLKANAKMLVEAKKNLNTNIDNFIKEAQKLGYSVNPKTGYVKKL